MMTNFTIKTDNLQNFLNSLGKDLADVVINVNDNGISAEVGRDTHYIKRSMDCGVTKTGSINISDLPKCKSFLNTCKKVEVSVTQNSRTGTLHIRTDGTSLQLPTSSYIQSQDKVGLISKLIKQSQENMWQTWHSQKLNYHAKVSGDSLKPATNFSKVLGGKFACKTEFDPQGKELVIRGGTKSKGTMFVKAPLFDIASPSISAKSAFDSWLPELLNNLPRGDLYIYTGDETVLVLEQPETNFLMVVIDQEYEED